MSYATDHASAYADVLEAGAAVTFTAISPGTYAEATDTWSGSATTTVVGYAVEIPADVRRYEALELVQREPKTLLFACSTYGSVPSLGMTVTWNSVVYTVRDVQVVAPDGSAIISTVVVAR